MMLAVVSHPVYIVQLILHQPCLLCAKFVHYPPCEIRSIYIIIVTCFLIFLGWPTPVCVHGERKGKWSCFLFLEFNGSFEYRLCSAI